MTIRAAGADDVPAVAALERDNLGADAWSEPLVREGVVGALPTVRYLVAEVEGAVVGQGALLYPEAFPHAVGPEAPAAGWLARVVAEERAELVDPEPLYLRRPDAVAAHPLKPVS